MCVCVLEYITCGRFASVTIFPGIVKVIEAMKDIHTSVGVSEAQTSCRHSPDHQERPAEMKMLSSQCCHDIICRSSVLLLHACVC